MDLQEQLEVGKQAEDFLQYLSEHPYFEGLLERVKLEMARQILELTPRCTEDFTYIKTRMEAMDDVMNAIRGDVYIGGEAFKKLNGIIDEDKGLL